MRLGYFPGCSLLGSSREYGESIEAIAPRLGWSLEEIPDWNCCGASAAHNLNHALSLALPARVLALAERAGMTDILVPCAACYSRLTVAHHELSGDSALRSRINGIIEMAYSGQARPVNFLELLARSITPELQKTLLPFPLKVVCYYGCLLVRPHKIMKPERVEDPLAMDDIMRRLGATPLDWAFKVECCGAGLSVSRTDIVSELSGRILDDAVRRGAEAIIVACPMCHSNLDMRRKNIEKHVGKRYSIPIVYVTQAIGLSLGIDARKLGLHRHFVPLTFPGNGKKVKSPEHEPKQIESRLTAAKE